MSLSFGVNLYLDLFFILLKFQFHWSMFLPFTLVWSQKKGGDSTKWGNRWKSLPKWLKIWLWRVNSIPPWAVESHFLTLAFKKVNILVLKKSSKGICLTSEYEFWRSVFSYLKMWLVWKIPKWLNLRVKVWHLAHLFLLWQNWLVVVFTSFD